MSSFQIPRLSHPSGELSFSPRTPWLAPLAGYSDLAFRLLCRSYGACVCTTEMISAKGLIYENTGTLKLLASSPEDSPLIVQLFGAEAEFLGEAVKRLKEAGYRYFDLNIGCSVPKVMRQMAGAAMLTSPKNILACAEAMIGYAGKGNVGFKLRLSPNESIPQWELPLALAELGAGWITLHPRYAKQYFHGKADWSQLAALRKKLPIPLVASGDLLSAYDGIRCLKETLCHTLMYARGALRNPAIFSDHCRLIQGLPLLPRKSSDLSLLLCSYLNLVKRHANGRDQTKRMRGILASFVKNLPNAREIRVRLCQAQVWEELFDIIETMIPKDTLIEEEKKDSLSEQYIP